MSGLLHLGCNRVDERAPTCGNSAQVVDRLLLFSTGKSLLGSAARASNRSSFPPELSAADRRVLNLLTKSAEAASGGRFEAVNYPVGDGHSARRNHDCNDAGLGRNNAAELRPFTRHVSGPVAHEMSLHAGFRPPELATASLFSPEPTSPALFTAGQALVSQQAILSVSCDQNLRLKFHQSC